MFVALAVLFLAVSAWFAARRYVLNAEAVKLAAQCKSGPAKRGSKSKLSPEARPVAVVTGGQGFLGQNIMQQLVTSGYYKTIRVFDMAGAKGVWKHESGVTIEFVVGNITDEPALQAAFDGADVVFHAAALIDTRRGALVMQRLTHVNVHGTGAVVRACVACGVPRLVYVSSAAACFRAQHIGVKDTVWDEDNCDFGLDTATQVYPYGRTKAAGELIVRHANGKDGLTTVAVRPYYIFGMGDLTTKMMLKAGKATPLFADGQMRSSAIYVKNAAAWIVNADGALRDAKRAPLVAGKAFFIGDGVRSMRQMNEMEWRGCTGSTGPYINSSIPYAVCWVMGHLIDIVDSLALHLSHNSMMFFNAATVAATTTTEQVYSFDRAAKLFNHSPVVPLVDAVLDMQRSAEAPLAKLKRESSVV